MIFVTRQWPPYRSGSDRLMTASSEADCSGRPTLLGILVELRPAAVDGRPPAGWRAFILDDVGSERDDAILRSPGALGIAQDPLPERWLVFGNERDAERPFDEQWALVEMCGDAIARKGVP